MSNNGSDTSPAGWIFSIVLTIISWAAVIYFIVLESQGKMPFAGMMLGAIFFGLVGCCGIFLIYKQFGQKG